MVMQEGGTVIFVVGQGHPHLCPRDSLGQRQSVAIVVWSNSSFGVWSGSVVFSPAVSGSQMLLPKTGIEAMKQRTTVRTRVGPWAGKQGLGVIGKWGIRGASAKGKTGNFGRTVAWGPELSFQGRLGVPPR